MHVLTRRLANWGSALGVLISHLPARNPLGKYRILSKGGCLGWKPPGTFWEQNINFFFFWLLGRERLLAFFQDMLADPSSTQSLSHLVCFILLKERCSPTLILFQRATLSQPQQPCQERKDERLEHELPWDFKCPTPAEDGKRSQERGEGQGPHIPCDEFHASH